MINKNFSLGATLFKHSKNHTVLEKKPLHNEVNENFQDIYKIIDSPQCHSKP